MALKNIYSQDTEYVPLPENAENLTGVALSPDRTHIALAHTNQNDPCPMISIFNIFNAFNYGEKQRNFRYLFKKDIRKVKPNKYPKWPFLTTPDFWLVWRTNSNSFLSIWIEWKLWVNPSYKQR